MTMTPAGRTKAKDIKRKTTSDICQFLLHFTTYFPNVSYANSSKRPRKEGCSNEGKKKQGRKKRRRQLETVKMERERGKKMEGRERNESNFGM